VPAALGKAPNTLGKGFAECRTRQWPLGKKWPAKQPLQRAICRALGKAFAECQASPRQRKRAVTAHETVMAALPSANPDGTRQSFSFLF